MQIITDSCDVEDDVIGEGIGGNKIWRNSGGLWNSSREENSTGPVADQPSRLRTLSGVGREGWPVVSFARATRALGRASLDARSGRPIGPPFIWE